MSAQPSSSQAVTARKMAKHPPRRLRGILSLDDFEAAARRYLPRPVFGYVAGAVETGSSFRANRDSFEHLRFAPRVLAGHTDRDQGTELFGQHYASPFGIAPMGLSALAAYDGDVVLARAARDFGIPAIMSSTSLTRLERVAEETGSKWFQAYLLGDNDNIRRMIARIAAAGYEYLVITADVPVPGNRENNIRNGFEVPLRPSLRLAWQGISHPGWLWNTAFRTLRKQGMPHFESMDPERGPPILSNSVNRSISGRETLNWSHIELVRSLWTGKLILKGILAPEDAARAQSIGCDGIIVSNHGGRQLDCAISSIEALPGVISEAGNMAVMLDGGVRRGTDIVKALALGAHFVFVGRPFLFAAAIAGHQGVTHCATLLASEINRNMAFLGVRSIEAIGPHLLRPAAYVHEL